MSIAAPSPPHERYRAASHERLSRRRGQALQRARGTTRDAGAVGPCRSCHPPTYWLPRKPATSANNQRQRVAREVQQLVIRRVDQARVARNQGATLLPRSPGFTLFVDLAELRCHVPPGGFR